MTGQLDMASGFNSFRDFYPYYLDEHRDVRCRRMHFIGSVLVLVTLALAVVHTPWWLLATPLVGYGFAWVGHFAFEKNKPATFKHPLWSLMGDWVMFWEIMRGRVKV